MTKKEIVANIMVAVRWLRDNGESVADTLESNGQASYVSLELLERTLGYKTKEVLNNILMALVSQIYA